MQTHTRRTDESNADDILIVLDPEDPEATMQTALPYAADDADEVYLLLVYPDDIVERRKQAHEEANTRGHSNFPQLMAEAEREAERVGREYLGEEAEFRALGTVGRRAPNVAAAAEWAGCTKVYVANATPGPLERIRRILDLPGDIAKELPDGVDLLAYEDLIAAHTDPAIESGSRPEGH